MDRGCGCIGAEKSGTLVPAICARGLWLGTPTAKNQNPIIPWRKCSAARTLGFYKNCRQSPDGSLVICCASDETISCGVRTPLTNAQYSSEKLLPHLKKLSCHRIKNVIASLNCRGIQSKCFNFGPPLCPMSQTADFQNSRLTEKNKTHYISLFKWHNVFPS